MLHGINDTDGESEMKEAKEPADDAVASQMCQIEGDFWYMHFSSEKEEAKYAAAESERQVRSGIR